MGSEYWRTRSELYEDASSDCLTRQIAGGKQASKQLHFGHTGTLKKTKIPCSRVIGRMDKEAIGFTGLFEK